MTYELRWCALLMALAAIAAVFPMTAVHKEVHEGTGQQQQVRDDSQQMSPMFAEEQKSNDGEENKKRNAASRSEPATLLRLNFVIHKISKQLAAVNSAQLLIPLNCAALRTKTCLTFSPAI